MNDKRETELGPLCIGLDLEVGHALGIRPVVSFGLVVGLFEESHVCS